MVFVHGGAFNFGSGSLDEYSPDYLLDENVIVVTFNYRLNVLGDTYHIDLDDNKKKEKANKIIYNTGYLVFRFSKL